MKLSVLLPYGVFLQSTEVLRIVAETNDGSIGLLPHRLDCVAALVPGILTYETQSGEARYLAIDEGVLVKAGDDVFVSVRQAIAGTNLADLHASVQREFLAVNQQDQQVRVAVTRMESDLLGRLAELRHDR
jgi:F-type H+-transporting ATPase subunit epsilon